MSSPITEQLKEPPDTSQTDTGAPRGRMLLIDLRVFNWSSIAFALLQSACTAVITISGLRVAIGLGALAAAAGVHACPRPWLSSRRHSHPHDGLGLPWGAHQPICNLESAEPAQQTRRSVAPAASDEEKTQFRAFSDRSLCPDPASPRCRMDHSPAGSPCPLM